MLKTPPPNLSRQRLVTPLLSDHKKGVIIVLSSASSSLIGKKAKTRTMTPFFRFLKSGKKSRHRLHSQTTFKLISYIKKESNRKKLRLFS